MTPSVALFRSVRADVDRSPGRRGIERIHHQVRQQLPDFILEATDLPVKIELLNELDTPVTELAFIEEYY